MTRFSQAVFLVGGRGTRLGALTATTPKPLLEVGGRPFLDYLIEEAARHGFERILLLAGHLATEVAGRYDGREMRGARISVLVEPEEGGTAGGLRFAAGRLDPQFLLANGDSFFDANLLALGEGAGAVRMALCAVPDIGRYGGVAFDGIHVRRFIEKGGIGPGLINAGIYRLNRDVILSRIAGLPCSLERDIFPALVADGAIEGCVLDGRFIDIGVPEDFAAAQDLVPALRQRPIALLDRDGVVNREIGYAHRPDQIEWMPGAMAAIRLLNEAHYHVAVITNQAGVARGYYGEKDVQDLHRWMQRRLREAGAHIDSFHYCPHHPTEGIGEYRRVCDCRKPAPGMVRAALALWSTRMKGSFLIGDKTSDLQAGAALGVPGILYDGSMPLDVAVSEILLRMQND